MITHSPTDQSGEAWIHQPIEARSNENQMKAKTPPYGSTNPCLAPRQRAARINWAAMQVLGCRPPVAADAKVAPKGQLTEHKYTGAHLRGRFSGRRASLEPRWFVL